MRRAILGDVEFSVVESESPERTNEITEKPVEQGANIADHVRPMPLVFAINGVVTGPDAAQKLSQLSRYRENAVRLTYVGRNLIRDLIIESLTTNHAVKIRDGFSFDLILKQVRIAVPRTAVYVGPDPAGSAVVGAAGTSAQNKAVQNKGTQQPAQQNADEANRQSLLRKIEIAAGSRG